MRRGFRMLGPGAAFVVLACGEDKDLRNGCPVLDEPVAEVGDEIDGDTWESFAAPFFDEYCVRCHSVEQADIDRHGAPEGKDWDDEAIVRENLDEIRLWVGEVNAMPIGAPMPTCDERFRLIQWIDAGAP